MNGNERRYLAGWLALPVAAAANGALRDATYGKRLGKTAAHSLAVAPLTALVLAWARLLERRWPLPGRGAAVRVGVVWLALTLLFESGLGAARGMSAGEIAGQYDVRRGRLWVLVPLAVLAAPELARRRAGRATRAPRAATDGAHGRRCG